MTRKKKEVARSPEPFEELSGLLGFSVTSKRKRRRGSGDVGGAEITLSNFTTSDVALVGDLVGTLAVLGGVGVYTFNFFFNPGKLFAISGASLNVDSSPLVVGQDIIVITADNGAGDIIHQGFIITVRHVNTGYVPTYELLGF